MSKLFINLQCFVGFHKAYKSEKDWTTRCKNCHKIEERSVYSGTTWHK